MKALNQQVWSNFAFLIGSRVLSMLLQVLGPHFEQQKSLCIDNKSMNRENESLSLIGTAGPQCPLAFSRIPYRTDGSAMSSSAESAALIWSDILLQRHCWCGQVCWPSWPCLLHSPNSCPSQAQHLSPFKVSHIFIEELLFPVFPPLTSLYRLCPELGPGIVE